MAAGHEDLDQLGTKESGGSCDKRRRSRVDYHVASVEPTCEGATTHNVPHRTLGRSSSGGSQISER